MLAKSCLRLFLATTLLIAPVWVHAQQDKDGEDAENSAATERAEYTRRGADSCWKCHNEEESDFPVMSIFRTRHAARQPR